MDLLEMNLPAYNPFQFELARHVRGLHRCELAKNCGMKTVDIKAIENGDRLPTADELKILMDDNALYFPEAFFTQWHEYILDMSGYLAKNVPIDYYKYKVFRDLNRPQMMKAV